MTKAFTGRVKMSPSLVANSELRRSAIRMAEYQALTSAIENGFMPVSAVVKITQHAIAVIVTGHSIGKDAMRRFLVGAQVDEFMSRFKLEEEETND